MSIAADDTTRLWALVAREFWRKTRRRLRAGRGLSLALFRPHARTRAHRPARPAPCRSADRARDLLRPLSAVRPSASRPAASRPSTSRCPIAAGSAACTASAGCATCAPPAPSSPPPMHGRSSPTGSPCTAAASPASAWEPATTAKRIIAWLQHSSVVLQGAEFAFYRAFLRSLAMQIRYLRSMAPRDAQRQGPAAGPHRARLRRAVVAGAGRQRCARPRATSPTNSTARSCPTAGTSRAIRWRCWKSSPTFCRCATPMPTRPRQPPAALINAVDRMLPALRFFRHQDGSLGRFNGMGATIHDRIAAILRHDDTGGAPPLHATHSGYERLSMGGTTVIADTGAPPPIDVSNHAHAGCLSFEMSSGRQHYIVNAGVDTYGIAELRPLARATAAHSTVTINDTSSASFSHSERVRGLLGSPMFDGPRSVPSERTDKTGIQGFIARHDGYARRFGLYHERELSLAAGGNIAVGLRPHPSWRQRADPEQWTRRHRHPVPRPSRRPVVPRPEGAAGADRPRPRHLGLHLGERPRRGRGIRSISPGLADRAARTRSCCPSRPRKSPRCTGSSPARASSAASKTTAPDSKLGDSLSGREQA